MNSFDVRTYLQIATRRFYWILIPFLVTALAGFGYVLRAPKLYEAQTLILVQPQKVPEDFVREIISSDIDARLKTIGQQVTSRTNLERIINEYGPFVSFEGLDTEKKVELFRSRIRIDVNKGGRQNEASAFTIAFRGKDPTKVMQVTNALASNFISENLRIRESQALGTSSFLGDELENIRKRLAEKEEELKEYQLRYMGSLPEQLQTNLSILERLQMQIDQLSSNLRDAENRKLIIQRQMGESEAMQRQLADGERRQGQGGTASSPPTTGRASEDLKALKKELGLLKSRYTDRHPDVIRLSKIIAEMEAGTDTRGSDEDEAGKDRAPREPSARETRIPKSQLDQIEIEIDTLKKEITKVKSRVEAYQKRIEETPKREQELLSLTRDYSNLRELYNSMLNRKLEAEIAVSMEKKQKGEQFRVVDPARAPRRPVEPDVRKIILMTLALGLALGFGLAYLAEVMDTSYKTPEEAEKELRIPVLLSLPLGYTEKELRKRKVKRVLVATSIAAGFVLSAIAIVLATKGNALTVKFIQKLIGSI